MDEFYRGAELGLKVSDQRMRQTNLAERAAQTNRQLDIDEKMANVNMSRLNLLNKQLDYNYTQQANDDSETTVQLDALKKYKEQLASAANAEGFTKLPQPPAGLHGIHQQDAFKAHQGYLVSRQNDLDYKRHVADLEDKNDLIDNYGLAADWQSREPLARDMSLESAQKERALATASRIAYEMRVSEADVQGFRLQQFFNPNTGKLDEDRFRSAMQPHSNLIMTGQTTHPTGGASKTYTTKDAVVRKAKTYTAKAALERGVRIKDEVRKRRQKLSDDINNSYTESQINEKIRQEFPPDGVRRDGSGNVIEVLYTGDQKQDANGNVVVYTGGDPSKKTSWSKVQ